MPLGKFDCSFQIEEILVVFSRFNFKSVKINHHLVVFNTSLLDLLLTLVVTMVRSKKTFGKSVGSRL